MRRGEKLALAWALFLLPGSALAAEAESWQIQGSFGGARFTESEWHAAPGVGVEKRITRRFHVGGELSFLYASERDQNVVLVARLLYDLRGRELKPYLVATAGLLWHRELVGFGPEGPPGLRPFWSSDPWLGGGIGVRVPLGERWTLSPELQAAWPLVVEAGVRLGFEL